MAAKKKPTTARAKPKKRVRTWAEIKAAKAAPTKVILIDLDDGAVAEFKFRALPRTRLRELVKEHEIKDDADYPLGFDPEVLGPVLVAESLESPAMSGDEVRELYDDPAWSFAEVDKLFSTAWTMNTSLV